MKTTGSSIRTSVPGLGRISFFLLVLLLAAASVQAAGKAENTDPSWALTFPEEVKIYAAGEYNADEQETVNFETFCALELEPSPTASFEVIPLEGFSSLKSVPVGAGSQVVFKDPVASLEPNPDYDPDSKTTSVNFPYKRASGSITSYGWVDKEFGDVKLEALVNTNLLEGGSQSRQGLMARWDKGNNFYWFYVNFASGDFGVTRSRFFGVYTDMEGSTGKVVNFDNQKPYSLELTLRGNRLWGNVYEVDADGQRGELVGSTGVLADDDPQLRGVSGVLLEIAGEAPMVPLEGSFTALVSTDLSRGGSPQDDHPRVARPKVDSESAIAMHQVAESRLAEGNLEQAVASLEEALKFDPEYVDALASLAWIQATSNNQRVRNPEQSVKYAEKLVGLVHFGQFRRNDLSSAPRAYWSMRDKVRTLNILAAAYASIGSFEAEGFSSDSSSGEVVEPGGAALPYARMALEVANRLHEMGQTAGSDKLLAETEKNFETFKLGLALYLDDSSQ